MWSKGSVEPWRGRVWLGRDKRTVMRILLASLRVLDNKWTLSACCRHYWLVFQTGFGGLSWLESSVYGYSCVTNECAELQFAVPERDVCARATE